VVALDGGQKVVEISGVAAARALGMRVIVPDHHLPGDRLPDADAIVKHIGEHARGGDVVVVFSNGGFGGIHGKLLQRLGRR